MIGTDIRFHPLSKKVTLFMGSILITNIVTAHKCFVCGPNNVDANIEYTSDLIPTCDKFDPNHPTFIRECLPESKGCSIQTNGTILTRTCERLAIIDCKKANNVEYCYCTASLCNKIHPTQIDDDEEDFEGSGVDRDRQPVTEITSVFQVPAMFSTTPTAIDSSAVIIYRISICNLFILWALVSLIS